MARKPTVIDNSFLVDMFNSIDGIGDLGSWMQDIIYGSSRLGHSNPSAAVAIFKALATLPVISFDTVKHFVNNRSEVIDQRTFSDRHVYAFMNRVLSARKGIEFYYERRTGQKFHVIEPVEAVDSTDFVYADGVKASELVYENVVRNHGTEH